MRKQGAVSLSLYSWVLSLLLLLTTCAVAQQQQSAPPGNPATSQSAAPEQKISKADAKALFQSVDEILQFASKDTGLPIKHSVKRKLASREEVSKYIQDRMKDDEDSKRLQRSEVVLKKFGLIPEQFDLRSFLADLLKEQVAGFYDTKKKTVFLLDWVEPEAQRPVLAHELTHALQDQNFNLDKWTKAAMAPRKSEKHRDLASDLMEDERLAAQEAVAEGQATVVLIDYMLAPYGQSAKANPQIADAVMAGMATTGQTPLYTKAPMFLKQLLLFPYQRGGKFETDVLARAGTEAAFAGTFRRPPANSRQILHPSTYLEHEVIPPMRVPDFTGAAGKEYSVYDMSVMGEFDVWLLAKQYSGQKSADSLGPMWRGGYYYAGLKPGTAKTSKGSVEVPTTAIALAYASRWASADAAEQFAAVYANALSKHYKSVREVGATNRQVPEIGATVMAGIADRLKGTRTWYTEQGPLSIETRGDTMLVMEGFDQAAAGRIRDAVFSPKLNQ